MKLDSLRAETPRHRIDLIAHEALSRCNLQVECPTYFSALQKALRDEPPPFARDAYFDLYNEASLDVRWMALSLMTNAEREGDGAKRLWSLSACSSSKVRQQLLKLHAVDESRHALFYLALLDLTFPGLTDPDFRIELRQLSPRYAMRMPLLAVAGSPYAKEPTLDDFVQMNIAEIRTTVHHLLQRNALASHAPTENRDHIGVILDTLLRDELKHVAYTAVLIEDLTRCHGHPDNIFAIFHKRLHDFNAITNEELDDHAFDCSVACCAKRPNCRPKVHRFVDAPL